MKKTIYFDMNIIADIKSQRDNYLELEDKIQQLKKDNFIFPYSPAHMEETQVIFENVKTDFQLNSENIKERIKDDYVDNQVELLSQISDNNELFPAFAGEIHIKNEHPSECLSRIQTNYFSTKIAEIDDLFFIALRNKDSLKKIFSDPLIYDQIIKLIIETDKALEKNISSQEAEYYKMCRTIISNNLAEYKHYRDIVVNNKDIDTWDIIQKKYQIDIDKINNQKFEYKMLFQEKSIIEYIRRKKPSLLNLKYEEIKLQYKLIEYCIQTFFNIVEEIGYQTERVKKYRSRMHDITHAIYGTKANFFVTRDNKFRNRLKAIYYKLEVPTVILDKKEFLEYNFSLAHSHSGEWERGEIVT